MLQSTTNEIPNITHLTDESLVDFTGDQLHLQSNVPLIDDCGLDVSDLFDDFPNECNLTFLSLCAHPLIPEDDFDYHLNNYLDDDDLNVVSSLLNDSVIDPSNVHPAFSVSPSSSPPNSVSKALELLDEEFESKSRNQEARLVAYNMKVEESRRAANRRSAAAYRERRKNKERKYYDDWMMKRRRVEAEFHKIRKYYIEMKNIDKILKEHQNSARLS